MPVCFYLVQTDEVCLSQEKESTCDNTAEPGQTFWDQKQDLMVVVYFPLPRCAVSYMAIKVSQRFKKNNKELKNNKKVIIMESTKKKIWKNMLHVAVHDFTTVTPKSLDMV